MTIYVHPVRTAIVKAGQTSGLKVLFKDKETGPNITAAQIAIWNDGNAPIHSENILEDITLQLDPHYTILEASVHKLSRSVTGFEIVPSPSDPGRLLIRWRILEPGDGAIVQLIYDGPTSPGDFMAKGTVEGQPKIVSVTPSDDTRTADRVYSSPRTQVIRAIAVVVPSFAVAAALISFASERLERLLFKNPLFAKWAFGAVIGSAISFVIGVFGYFMLKPFLMPYPPFGF